MLSPHHFTFTSGLQIDVAALHFLNKYKHVNLHVSHELTAEAVTQVLSCEYCKIFKKIFFEKHLETAASVTGECEKNALSSTSGSTLLSSPTNSFL